MMYGDGVLEMSSRQTITGYDSPTVVEHVEGRIAHRYHRLDGNTEAVFDLLSGSTLPVVGHLRILVHFVANAMTDKLPNNSISLRFAMALHCVANIAKAMTGKRLFYCFIKRLFGGFQQGFCLVVDFSNTECVAGVATETINQRSAIDRNDVAVLEGRIVRYAVNNYFVDRSADGSRKVGAIRIRKTFERRDCSVIADEFLGQSVKLARRDARLDDLGDFSEWLR